MKLHLGCGSKLVEGWLNVDYALGARFAKVPFFRAANKKLKMFRFDWDERISIQDLSKKFPWPDGSADMIYSSHLLEHFSREEGYRFLDKCFHVLKTGGIMRIVVPDLSFIVSRYFNGSIRADHFLENVNVLYSTYRNPFKKKLAPFVQFPHKCMYDRDNLISTMREIGFRTESKQAFESRIPDIESIELPMRVLNAVIVEGEKTAT